MRTVGYYYDADTENYYLKNRYYDSSDARFLTVDPYWNAYNMIYGNATDSVIRNVYYPAVVQSGNRFGYGMNNPIRWFDPWGLELRLTGAENEEDERFIALQTLTEDTLTLDVSTGYITIESYVDDECITKPTGTNMIRELILHSSTIDIVVSDKECAFYKKGSKDRFNNFYNEDTIVYNPNTTVKAYEIHRDPVSLETVLKQDIIPNYIALGHELVHGYRHQNDITAEGNGTYYPLWENEIIITNPQKLFPPVKELETVGLPYISVSEYKVSMSSSGISILKEGDFKNAYEDFKYSENKLRVENLVPIRMRY